MVLFVKTVLKSKAERTWEWEFDLCFSKWSISIHRALLLHHIRSCQLQITLVYFFSRVSSGFSKNLFFHYGLRVLSAEVMRRAEKLSGLYLGSWKHRKMLQTLIGKTKSSSLERLWPKWRISIHIITQGLWFIMWTKVSYFISIYFI